RVARARRCDMRYRRKLAGVLANLLVAGCSASNSSLVASETAILVQTKPNIPASTQRSQQPEEAPGNSNIQRTVFESVPESYPKIPQARVAERIRAQVNGVAILDDEVRQACYPKLIGTVNMAEPERTLQQAKIVREEMDNIIDREVLLQDAYTHLAKNGTQYLEKLNVASEKEFDKMVRGMKMRASVKTDEELKEFLRSQGQSLESLRQQTRKNFIAREYMRSRVYPSVERVGHQQIL